MMPHKIVLSIFKFRSLYLSSLNFMFYFVKNNLFIVLKL